MLKDKVIIYDDSCPMCKLYTYWFVAWGFLQAENRMGFANVPTSISEKLDVDRGRHEIPLYDRRTGETIYGLNALTFILASRWKFLQPVFQSRLFWLVFYPLYQIITYNRRVVSGCRHCGGFDCAPDVSRFYRGAYLVLVLSFVVAIMAGLSLATNPIGVIGLAALIAFSLSGLIVGCFNWAFNEDFKGWDYLGSFWTAVAEVALLMLPICLLPSEATTAGWTIVFVATILGVTEFRRRKL